MKYFLLFLALLATGYSQTTGNIRMSYFSNSVWNSGTWTGTNVVPFLDGTSTPATISVTGTFPLIANGGTATMISSNTIPAGPGAFLVTILITNAPNGANSVWGGTNRIIFEGATADANEGMVTTVDVSSDRTWTFQDYTGHPEVAQNNVVAGDQTLVLASVPYQAYSGTGGHTWTIPLLSTGRLIPFFVKNRGSGNLTVARSGGDQIYDTAPVNSIIMAPGEARIFVPDLNYWLLE